MKVGTRVVRGNDWKGEDQDGNAEGTVTNLKPIGSPGWFMVKWNKGRYEVYRMGAENSYDLQFAPVK